MTNVQAESPALVLARHLIALRRRVAPPNSVRERLMRALYIPWMARLAARERLARSGKPPVPSVMSISGPRPLPGALPRNARILVLKLDHLGELILTLRAFEHLRNGFPEADITLVCGSWNHAWAAQCGLFDRVVPFDLFAAQQGEARQTTIARQFAAFDGLQLGAYDLAMDLRHDPDTRPLLARVDAAFRAGFCAPADAGGSSLDIALPDMEHVSVEAGTGRPVHAELRALLLASAVTATFSQATHPVHRLGGDGARRSIPSEPYAIIAPGAGSPIRVWPIDRMAEVARALHERHGLAIVVTGASANHAAGQQIIASLPNETARNLTGKVPLADLPDLIRAARLYVGLDTGTTHLAASLGVPTVAITSGVPDLEVWRAQGERTVVLAGRMPCSPCYFIHATQCPYGVACLTVISTDDVVSACDALLRPAVSQALSEPAN